MYFLINSLDCPKQRSQYPEFSCQRGKKNPLKRRVVKLVEFEVKKKILSTFFCSTSNQKRLVFNSKVSMSRPSKLRNCPPTDIFSLRALFFFTRECRTKRNSNWLKITNSEDDDGFCPLLRLRLNDFTRWPFFFPVKQMEIVTRQILYRRTL